MDEQTEYDMGGERPSQTAMDEAVEAAVRAGAVPGQEGPSEETVRAARERAQQMLEQMSGKEAEGLKDLQNLTLSQGLPATRDLFRHMIRARNLRGAEKRRALKAVEDFSPITEVGCMRVDFHNRATGRADTAYLVLAECPRDHNFNAQLDKIFPIIAEEKHDEVKRHLSMLFNIGRSVYYNTAVRHLDLIRRINGLKADDPCSDYTIPRIDPANTTIYINEAWPNRVGLFVRLASEVGEK